MVTEQELKEHIYELEFALENMCVISSNFANVVIQYVEKEEYIKCPLCGIREPHDHKGMLN